MIAGQSFCLRDCLRPLRIGISSPARANAPARGVAMMATTACGPSQFEG